MRIRYNVKYKAIKFDNTNKRASIMSDRDNLDRRFNIPSDRSFRNRADFIPPPSFFSTECRNVISAASRKKEWISPRGGSAEGRRLRHGSLTTLPRIVTALCFQSSSSSRGSSLADTPARSHFTVEQRVALDSPPGAPPFSILSDSDRLSKEFPPSLGQSIEPGARVVAKLVPSFFFLFFFSFMFLAELDSFRDEGGETLLRSKYFYIIYFFLMRQFLN